MGLRGPAPKPLELVKAAGNPGKRKINKTPPKFKPKMPACPTYLDEIAKAEWKRIGPELFNMRLMTTGDMAAFTAYCVSYSRFVAAEKMIKREGMVTIAQSGYQMPHPAIAISNQAMKLIKDFAVQFGFTPSARGRIQLPEGGDDGDEDLD